MERPASEANFTNREQIEEASIEQRVNASSTISLATSHLVAGSHCRF